MEASPPEKSGDLHMTGFMEQSGSPLMKLSLYPPFRCRNHGSEQIKTASLAAFLHALHGSFLPGMAKQWAKSQQVEI